MKKLICITVILCIAAVAVVWAAETVEITISIPAVHVTEFLTGYLAERPIPTKNGTPLYTAKEWVKFKTKEDMDNVYKLGKDKLRPPQPPAVYEPNILE